MKYLDEDLFFPFRLLHNLNYNEINHLTLFFFLRKRSSEMFLLSQLKSLLQKHIVYYWLFDLLAFENIMVIYREKTILKSLIHK